MALKERSRIKIQPRQATQRSHHSPVDRENLSLMLTSTNWWSSQKRRTTHKTFKQAKGKLESKRFYHTIRYTFAVQYTYITQACYDLPFITLRLDSTHPDTYNLVGFSGCLHLWWIPLLTLELCVTSVTMNQFSRTQG